MTPSAPPCRHGLSSRLLLILLASAGVAALISGGSEEGTVSLATLNDLHTLRNRLIQFYLTFGDCTQTQFCLQGGYMLPLPGGDCALTCGPATTAAASLNSTGGWADVE